MSYPSHATIGGRLLAVLLAAALLVACGGSNSDDPSPRTAALDLTFSAADGGSARLGDFAGTPVVVNLWATWCSPCVKEMPAFDEVAAELQGRVAIIGVSVADEPTAAAAFAADLGVTYPIYADPDGGLQTAFSVASLPATVFIGADGTVLDVHSGAYTADELRAAINASFPDQGL